MSFVTRVFLPFLLLSYISYETYLKFNNSTTCESSGCQLASQLLQFDAIYLNFIGIAGLVILLIVGFKSIKNESFEKVFHVVLYSALLFEVTLFSFQMVVNSEICTFCLIVVSSLFAITILNNIQNSLFTTSIVIAIFIALNILSIPKNKPTINATGNYLIESSKCSHCQQIKEFLNTNNIEYTAISVHNPNSLTFLKFLNIDSVPTLIVKKSNKTEVINGPEAIIDTFMINPKQEPQPSNTSLMSNDLLTQGSSDGCAIAIVPEPCETDIPPFEASK